VSAEGGGNDSGARERGAREVSAEGGENDDCGRGEESTRSDANDVSGASATGGAPDAGRDRIVLVDTIGTVVFTVSAVLEVVVFRHWTQILGVTVALVLFAIGCAAFLAGYARAIQRSRSEEISVTGLYLLAGPAVPGPVKRRLGLLLAVQIVVALVTAGIRTFTPLAFGVLVPVFGLGLNGLWAARHGRFPPRRKQTRPTSPAPEHHSEGGMEQNADHG
jgi:hypothetical protein